jgi:hypothetical protein
MEDLKAGRIAASLKPRKPHKDVNAVLIVTSDALLEEKVKTHRSVGDRTAFLSTDRALGTRLAQRYGARFYPCDIIDDTIIEATAADLRKHWSLEELKIEN